MAYNYEYPYTDPNRYNADWLLKKMQDIETRLDNIIEETLEQTKKYVDDRLKNYQSQIDSLYARFNALKESVNNQIADINNDLISEVERLDKRVNDAETLAQNLFNIANSRTDKAIALNNEYIFKEINDNVLSNITVINYFTGEKVSVQSMFDYLASLHLTSAITYVQLAEKDITVNALIALNITYTELVQNGIN